MDNEPRQVGCNGSGWPIFSTSNEDEYLPAEREGEVKHDLETPPPSLRSWVTEVSQGPAAAAISNIERRLASMDQGINGRLNIMDGRLAVLEGAVLRQPTTTAAMTTSRIVACPVSSPTSSLGDSEDSEIRVAYNKYLEQTV
ncbi:unnamed protein product [Dibothriocephalus latus]|uniref:Uncharacterized protein n=1 Tax=Dibothriocephalus latus TaxID=60516 RepID=A0A3P7Q869_DIBLA|nr:unnamed protein product [Dibothriocephalus latus]